MAQELSADAHTLLLLHFNGDLTGADGEVPLVAAGTTFEAGVFGQGAYFGSPNDVLYPSTGNIDATSGTLEFWIKPLWPGNDGQDHYLLRFGVAGGLLFGKDGGNFWRIIMNRYGSGGQPEVGTGLYINDWQPGAWRHTAYTWNVDSLKVYVDGSLAAQTSLFINPPAVAEALFQIGADGPGDYLEAVIDELRLSDVERSAQEITESYLAGLTITELEVEPENIDMLETWWQTPQLRAVTPAGPRPLPPAAATWWSSDDSVASVDANGRITGVSAGGAVVTAEISSWQAHVSVTVEAPLRPPEVMTIPPALATPASGYLYEMPVVIISYMPTLDGVHVDAGTAGWTSTLEELDKRIDTFNLRVKFMLEEGSRFRGYKDPGARPSLGYRVVHMVTVYEPLPRGFQNPGNGIYEPDYRQIVTRFNGEHFVNDLGVREFWLWGYHHGDIAPVESNMSSPTTGDISNSYRRDDLPVYDHTYVVYNYNFTRTQAEAAHNHGHQLEAILTHAAFLQAGNADFLWQKWVGQDDHGNPITGRCGNTHMPPNTTEHYDYLNPILVWSDIEDWQPDGGTPQLVNADTWGGIPYAWPGGAVGVPQRTESQYYIYWMQAMPGDHNGIPYQGQLMTDWWRFTADWDEAITRSLGLYGPGLIFDDGFESGDVSRWSVSVGS